MTEQNKSSGCCAVDIYCTAALTSLSGSVSYITFFFRMTYYLQKTSQIDYEVIQLPRDQYLSALQTQVNSVFP